jgi:uncharacterized protein with HEPN domain
MTKVKHIAWLLDIRQAIEAIERHPKYAAGRAAYDEDEYFRAVVYLYLERICEAAKHLCDEHDFDEKFPEIPWRNIIGTRVIIAHHYWDIEDDIIWNVVEQHLPALKAKVCEWLDAP